MIDGKDRFLSPGDVLDSRVHRDIQYEFVGRPYVGVMKFAVKDKKYPAASRFSIGIGRAESLTQDLIESLDSHYSVIMSK